MRIFKVSSTEASMDDPLFMINVVCAWCGAIMDQQHSVKNHDTHGICEKCTQEVMDEYKKFKTIMHHDGLR